MKQRKSLMNITHTRITPNNSSPRYNIFLRHKVEHFAGNIRISKFNIEIDQRRGNVGICGQPINDYALMEGNAKMKEVKRGTCFEKTWEGVGVRRDLCIEHGCVGDENLTVSTLG
jgi:hypothetical protein